MPNGWLSIIWHFPSCQNPRKAPLGTPLSGGISHPDKQKGRIHDIEYGQRIDWYGTDTGRHFLSSFNLLSWWLKYNTPPTAISITSTKTINAPILYSFLFISYKPKTCKKRYYYGGQTTQINNPLLFYIAKYRRKYHRSSNIFGYIHKPFAQFLLHTSQSYTLFRNIQNGWHKINIYGWKEAGIYNNVSQADTLQPSGRHPRYIMGGKASCRKSRAAIHLCSYFTSIYKIWCNKVFLFRQLSAKKLSADYPKSISFCRKMFVALHLITFIISHHGK